MIVGTNSRMPEKEAGFYMRKRLLAVILCAYMLFPASVSAEISGYEATLNTYTQEKKTAQQFQVDDGAGNTVNALAKSDTLYVTAKNTAIRSNPGKAAQSSVPCFLEQNWSGLQFVTMDGARLLSRKMEKIRSAVMFDSVLR